MLLEKKSITSGTGDENAIIIGIGAALREFHVAYGSMPNTKDKESVEDIVFYMIERDL